MYKKALNKALGSNSKSEQFIKLLQEFIKDSEPDSEEINQDDNTSDKRILIFQSQCYRIQKNDAIKDVL